MFLLLSGAMMLLNYALSYSFYDDNKSDSYFMDTCERINSNSQRRSRIRLAGSLCSNSRVKPVCNCETNILSE